jgi:Transposase zinc-binding domain
MEQERFNLEGFKEIFNDHYEKFLKKYPKYEATREVVEKMLNCGEEKQGYMEYICPCCNKKKRIAFS